MTTQSIRHSLPQQELVDGLLLPHALHDQTVQVDEQSAAKSTGDSTDKDKAAVCVLKVGREMIFSISSDTKQLLVISLAPSVTSV